MAVRDEILKAWNRAFGRVARKRDNPTDDEIMAAEREVLAKVPPLSTKESLTSNKEGTLQMQPSGRWAICRPGFDPIEITSGDVFRVEVPGEAGLRRTRMEHMHGEGYYSVNGYNLRDDLRAAIGAED